MTTKRERQISIISNGIAKCVKTNSASVYSYGNIPVKCVIGARSSYIGAVDYDDILGLIDTTVWGSGKRGMVFTDQGVYLRAMLEDSVYCPYSNLTEFNIPDDTYFDSSGLLDMLQELFNLEQEFEEPSLGDEIISGLLDLTEDAIKEMASSWMEKFDKEFEDRQNQEKEETIEGLQSCREAISGFITSIKEHLEQKVDTDDTEGVEDYLEAVYNLSRLLNGQGIDELDIEPLDYWNDVTETLDSIFMDDAAEEMDLVQISIKKECKIFHHRIEMILDDWEDEDITEDEAYSQCSKELQRMSGILKTAKKNLNKMIEYVYMED